MNGPMKSVRTKTSWSEPPCRGGLTLVPCIYIALGWSAVIGRITILLTLGIPVD